MKTQTLTGRSILVVEGEIREALDLQDCFAEAGARVFTAYRLECALRHALNTSLSAAVIDISNRAGHSAALCRHLVSRDVPFVFYGARLPAELEEWADAPFVTKPTELRRAVDIVVRLLNESVPMAATNGRELLPARINAPFHTGSCGQRRQLSW